MYRLLSASMLILLFAATYRGSSSAEVSLKGFIIDNACAASNADKPERIKTHAVSCALMESCRRSGYSLYVDGKFYKLDEAGNNMIVRTSKGGTKPNQKGFPVVVEGTIEGDTIQVTRITPVRD
jgi:hypothetical protein